MQTALQTPDTMMQKNSILALYVLVYQVPREGHSEGVEDKSPGQLED